MNFTQWKNFGYPGQELTPFEPVLARDNLVTLTNYGRLCSILFVTTPVCHCLFGFFQPLSTVPLLLAAGAAFFLLPLAAGTKVAVIGDFAETPRYQGAGSSAVNSIKVDSLLGCWAESGLEQVGFAAGFDRQGKPDAAKQAEAVALAQKADVVLLCMGLDEIKESEGLDRSDMCVASNQIELLRALQKVNPNIVVVLSAGASVETPWANHCKALVYGCLGGQAGAGALVEVLTGAQNPCGKLAETWARSYADTPANAHFGGAGRTVEYREGLYVGYRYYDTAGVPTAFPFGYGLSYTSFALSDLCVPESVRIDDEPLAVQVNVKNTGAMAGSEVVQLYVHDGACCYDRPEKELKAFCKVYLQPGEEKTVTLTLKKEDFAGWYADFGEWIVQPGRFELLLGISAEDIRLTASVRVRCRDPFGLSGRTAIGALVKDRQALEIVNRIMEDDMETLAAVALAYAPDKTLQELWNATNIHGALLRKGWDEEEIARRYAAIMEEFEELQARKI